MYKLSRGDNNGQPTKNEQERMDTEKPIGFEETNEGEDKLTPKQEATVAMILDGRSDGEISRELKLRRQTVNEWRNHHTAFRMEVKLRREQAWETQQKKLSQLVEKALDLLGEYLEHENEQVRLMAALYLLRLPATQTNLKNNETMDVKSRYLEMERKLKGLA